MVPKRIVVVMLAAQMIAAVALAQDATSSEFGRASGGEIEVMTKGPKNFSGSLAASFGSFGTRGYEGTLGGTLFQDRLWFFAAGQQQDQRLFARVPEMRLPAGVVSNAVDAKLMGQLGDRHNFAASFQNARQPYAAIPDAVTGVVPSSFLTMRYTGIVTSSMFFNVSISRSSAQPPQY
jgi:hypothetical protein